MSRRPTLLEFVGLVLALPVIIPVAALWAFFWLWAQGFSYLARVGIGQWK